MSPPTNIAKVKQQIEESCQTAYYEGFKLYVKPDSPSVDQPKPLTPTPASRSEYLGQCHLELQTVYVAQLKAFPGQEPQLITPQHFTNAAQYARSRGFKPTATSIELGGQTVSHAPDAKELDLGLGMRMSLAQLNLALEHEGGHLEDFAMIEKALPGYTAAKASGNLPVNMRINFVFQAIAMGLNRSELPAFQLGHRQFQARISQTSMPNLAIEVFKIVSELLRYGRESSDPRHIQRFFETDTSTNRFHIALRLKKEQKTYFRNPGEKLGLELLAAFLVVAGKKEEYLHKFPQTAEVFSQLDPNTIEFFRLSILGARGFLNTKP